MPGTWLYNLHLHGAIGLGSPPLRFLCTDGDAFRKGRQFCALQKGVQDYQGVLLLLRIGYGQIFLLFYEQVTEMPFRSNFHINLKIAPTKAI